MLSALKNNRFAMPRLYSMVLVFICAAAALPAWTTNANAAVLFFDTFEEGTGSPAYPLLADSAGSAIASNGWVNNGTANALYYDPTGTFGYIGGTDGDNVQGDLPDSTQVKDGQAVYLQGLSNMRNNLTTNFSISTVAGSTYTLSARAGDSLPANHDSADIRLSLFVAGLEVAFATNTATTNTFPSGGYIFDTLTTNSYVAPTSGLSMEIRFDGGPAGGGGVTKISFIDNVQLDAEAAAAVPEPSTFVLAALGLAGLGLLAWRRRKANVE